MSNRAAGKSLLGEQQETVQAIELICLGARMQVLETETQLTRTRLLRLYREVRGMSPPKGMLPFSTDWFIRWLPNIHASLFYNFYERLCSDAGASRIDALTSAYKLYLEQVRCATEDEPVLAFTRAWTLLRFFESEQLELITCETCVGKFVTHAHTPLHGYICGICRPPSRAGSKNKAPMPAERTAA